MRYTTCLLLAFMLLDYNYGQSNSSQEYTAFVKYNGSPSSGVISVIASGIGKDRAISVKNGITSAFYTLLFRGIPGSQYELPMIPNESEKKDDPVIKALLDNGYSSFLIESSVISEVDRKKKADGMKGKMTQSLLSINCDALRRYLEQNKVIRKFGI